MVGHPGQDRAGSGLMGNRIAALRVRGLRTLADTELTLDGLTVLIGPNSSGKSSIIEACEIVRKLAQPEFLRTFNEIHGGLPGLLRHGERELMLGVSITSDDQPDLEYSITITRGPLGHARIAAERLDAISDMGGTQLMLERRADGRVMVSDGSAEVVERGALQAEQTIPSVAGSGRLGSPALDRVHTALSSIEVHCPVDVLSTWIGASLQRESSLRQSRPLMQVERLGLEGRNLVNAFFQLKNSQNAESWRETMRYIQLGLGDDVEDVVLKVDPAGGALALWLQYRSFPDPVSARFLSDGTLAWLAFVALFRMSGPGGLLAFDEPESHIHPHLLMRVLDLFESMAHDRPVLLATHSDRLLDGLSEPAKSVVLCELDESRATRLRRPDPDALEKWLTDYRGIGDLRSAGYEDLIMKKSREPGMGLRRSRA